MTKWIPLWAIPVLIIFAIGTVWLRLSIVRTTYAINQTSKLTEKARQDREHTQLKLTAMRSPGRLEGLARTKFGWVQPRADQVIYLKPLETVGNGR